MSRFTKNKASKMRISQLLRQKTSVIHDTAADLESYSMKERQLVFIEVKMCSDFVWHESD